MIQGGDDPCFALETLAEALRGNFDRNVAAEPGIAGAVNLAHAALADGLDDLVRAELVPGS